MEIMFRTTEPYRCPGCTKLVNVNPCPACLARERVGHASLADGLLLAAGKRNERAIHQANETAAFYDRF